MRDCPWGCIEDVSIERISTHWYDNFIGLTNFIAKCDQRYNWYNFIFILSFAKMRHDMGGVTFQICRKCPIKEKWLLKNLNELASSWFFMAGTSTWLIKIHTCQKVAYLPNKPKYLKWRGVDILLRAWNYPWQQPSYKIITQKGKCTWRSFCLIYKEIEWKFQLRMKLKRMFLQEQDMNEWNNRYLSEWPKHRVHCKEIIIKRFPIDSGSKTKWF